MALKLRLALAVLGLFAVGTVQAVVIVGLEDATNGGGFFGKVTVADTAGGVKVTADIADPINVGLTKGDILGLGFQIVDESLLSGITTVDGDPSGIITGTCFDANNCDVFKGGSGSPGTDFDIVISLGANGASAGFVQTLSFEMLGIGISEAQFDEQSVGMRVQSIEGTEVYTARSSKLIGSGSTSVPEPGTLVLIGAGLLGIGVFPRRRPSA